MQVRLVQFAAGLDASENLSTARRLALGDLTSLEAGDGRVIVLPEASMHDFGSPDLPLGNIAQPLDGPFVAAIGELARQSGSTVVAGMFERSDDACRPFNTVVVVGPGGGVLAVHRKAYLYDAFGYRESDRLCSGDGAAVTVPVGDLTLGLLTCYELRFPEAARGLVDAGADTFVVPAAWVPGPLKEDHWTTLARARAIESTVYVVAAGQAAPRYIGSSLVVDPDGVILAGLGPAEGVCDARLTADAIAAARRRNPSLANRRTTS